MNYIKKKHLSRRTFLRGAGGVAVALPLLDSMLPASSAWAQAAARPKSRYSAIYIPHGAVMDKWTPATEGKGFAMSDTLKPFEPFKDQMTVISNLRLTSGYAPDGSAGAHHGRSSGTWLNCALPSADDPSATGVSVDQVAAKAISMDTPLPSIELTVEDGRSMSWSTPNTNLPMLINPQVVFEKLFGEGGTEAQRLARRAQAGSLLDSVMDDIGSVKRDLPARDVARMDQYLTDVREVERRIQLAGQLPEGLRLPARPNGIPTDFEAHVKSLMDLNVLAWQAEITRVSTLMVAREVTGTTYPNSGVRDAFHNLSHHSNIQANKDRLAILNAYHATQIAYFIDKLKKTPDGDGNLLDHSLVMYGSGMSNSNAHDHDPLPIVLLGGASGRMEGDRHLKFETHTPLANLHVAVLNKLGVEASSFADSTGILPI